MDEADSGWARRRVQGGGKWKSWVGGAEVLGEDGWERCGAGECPGTTWGEEPGSEFLGGWAGPGSEEDMSGRDGSGNRRTV